MKAILFVLIIFTVISCIKIGPDYMDEEANLISFIVKSEVGDTYREVRIFSKERKIGVLVNVDSTIHNALNKSGNDFTFPENEGFVLGIEADSVALIKSGVFELVVLKKDNSLLRQEFGDISDGISQPSFKIYLSSNGIRVE